MANYPNYVQYIYTANSTTTGGTKTWTNSGVSGLNFVYPGQKITKFTPETIIPNSMNNDDPTKKIVIIHGGESLSLTRVERDLLEKNKQINYCEECGRGTDKIVYHLMADNLDDIKNLIGEEESEAEDEDTPPIDLIDYYEKEDRK
jgi:hypothetical protein